MLKQTRQSIYGARATFSPDSSFFLVNYSSFYDSTPSELRRTSDGMLIMRLAGALDYFKSASFIGEIFILHYENKQSEVWQSGPTPHRLATLGFGFEGYLDSQSFVISPNRQALVARYSTGNVDLLDLGWLRAMGGSPAALPAEELVRLACAGPLASSFWTTEDQQLLDAALGSWGAHACGI